MATGTLLGFDIGSSSVKSALLRDGKIVGKVMRAGFETRYNGPCVEVDARQITRAIAQVVRQVGAGVRKVDEIVLAVMAPSWVAMDKVGRAITPVVTHQDRRSVEEARALEERVGKQRYLRWPEPGRFPAGSA